MHDLDGLIGQQFGSLERSGHEWVVSFDASNTLTIACLWRLLEDQRICVTRTDDQQQFGLPAPVDAAAKVKRSIGGSTVVTVALQEGTLDLTLGLDTGHIFQILPDSSGYEAWQATIFGKSFIALGGGELATFGNG